MKKFVDSLIGVRERPNKNKQVGYETPDVTREDLLFNTIDHETGDAEDEKNGTRKVLYPSSKLLIGNVIVFDPDAD